jgi:hypothetical protein
VVLPHDNHAAGSRVLKVKRPHIYARPEAAVQKIVNVTMPTLADMRKKYQELGLTPDEIETEVIVERCVICICVRDREQRRYIARGLEPPTYGLK